MFIAISFPIRTAFAAPQYLIYCTCIFIWDTFFISLLNYWVNGGLEVCVHFLKCGSIPNLLIFRLDNLFITDSRVLKSLVLLSTSPLRPIINCLIYFGTWVLGVFIIVTFSWYTDSFHLYIMTFFVSFYTSCLEVSFV